VLLRCCINTTTRLTRDPTRPIRVPVWMVLHPPGILAGRLSSKYGFATVLDPWAIVTQP